MLKLGQFLNKIFYGMFAYNGLRIQFFRKGLLIFSSVFLLVASCGNEEDRTPLNYKTIHQIQLEEFRNRIPLSLPESEWKIKKEALLPLSVPIVGKQVMGFMPYWSTSTSNIQWDLLTILAYFAAEVDPSTGNLTNLHGWPSSAPIATAHANGVKVLLTATLFGATNISTFLNSASARSNFISQILNQVQSAGADGVCIDFEFPGSSQRTNFTNFITGLANTFHTNIPGSLVTIATPAVDWNGSFDYNSLTNSADYLFIMAYDYHWSGGDPGPVSPLVSEGVWSPDGISVQKTLNTYIYGSSGVGDTKKNKLILGLPYYGFNWPTTNNCVLPDTKTANATAILYNSAEPNSQVYGKKWDTGFSYGPDGGSWGPYYCYVSTANQQVWYDDWVSLGVKFGLVNRLGLGGTGMWALNYDGTRTELWEEIRRQFGPGVLRLSHTIDDDTTGGSSGNANGIPEPGETIELPLTLKNNSTLNLSAVRAELWTSDPYITMIDDNEYYGNIAGGGQATSSIDGDYDFTISPSTPSNHILNFTLDIYEGIRQFKDNFDGASTSWTTACSLGSGVWARGVPGTGPLSAHSNTQVFATNLSGTYPNSVDCTLTSPAFQIPNGPYAHLTFWHWYDIEWQYDVGYVELRHAAPVSGGCTGVTWSGWKKIYPVGGYPGRTIGGSSSNTYNIWAYMGQSNGWQKADFDITPFVPNCIQVRFRFETDGLTVAQGWFIDSLIVNEGRGVWSDTFTITVMGGDTTPPSFLNITATPNPAKYNDNVTISFTASEPLSSNPTVTVSGRSATFVSLTGLDYIYSYTVIAQSPEINGSNTISVSGTDLSGNSGTSTSTLTINFDYDNDGMPDAWEAQNGLNPLINDSQEDPDGDGIINLEEYQLGLNPQLPNWGSILVSSNPSGGSVFLDGNVVYAGQYKGQSGDALNPLNIGNLKNELHTIRIILPDYTPCFQRVLVQGGGTSSVSCNLTPFRSPTYSNKAQIYSNGAPVQSPGGYSAPILIDWDEDGDKDLLLGNGDGTISLYLNSSTNLLTLSYSGLIQSGGVPVDVGSGAQVFVADWNNDNKKDLIIGDTTGKVRLYINQGTNSNPSYSNYSFVQYNGIDIAVDGLYSSPWVLDWDNDGKKDLVVGNGVGQVEIYINTGSDSTPLFTGKLYANELGTLPSVPVKPVLLHPVSFSSNLVPSSGTIPLQWFMLEVSDYIISNIYGSQWTFTSTYPDTGNYTGRRIYFYNSDVRTDPAITSPTPCFADVNLDGIMDLVIGDATGYAYLLTGSYLPGDIDNSKKVDGGDLILLNLSFGKNHGVAGFNPFADLDGNGTVDINDKNILLNNFGKTF